MPNDFKFNGINTFVETKNMPGEDLIIKAIDDEKMTIMTKVWMETGGVI